MAGRNPSEAVRAYVAPIQEAVSCFLVGKVTADAFQADTDGILTLGRAKPVPLFGTSGVTLTVSQRYRVLQTEVHHQGPWKVSTTGYMYTLNDRDGREIVSYHWHPVSASHVKRPHLHLDGDKAHLPTGRILLEEVLDLTREHGAEPSAKWGDVYEANRTGFTRGATWGVGPSPGSPSSSG